MKCSFFATFLSRLHLLNIDCWFGLSVVFVALLVNIECWFGLSVVFAALLVNFEGNVQYIMTFENVQK